MAQFAQGLGFDLTDPFTGHVKNLANFLEGFHPPVVQAIAQAQHIAFAGAEGGQNTLQVFTKQVLGNVLLGILDVGFDEIAQAGILFLADWGLQGDRQLGTLGDEAQFFDGHFHRFGDFLFRWLPAEFLRENLGGFLDPGDRFVEVHRQADGAALVGNGSCDCLTNPPGGVSGELVALFVVELFGCPNQAKASFLNQVLEAQAPIHVLLGNRDHQAQVGLHHLFLGPSAQHQAPAEADERHFHQGRPLFVVGFPAVVAFKLSGEFLEIKKIGNFAGQFDLFVGTQQSNPADFLQINPDGVFGVNAFRPDLDAGQGFGLGFFLSGCGFGFLFGGGFCCSCFSCRGFGGCFLCCGLFRGGFRLGGFRRSLFG